MRVVRPSDQLPGSWVKSMFLAGPTPRDSETASWRPRALELLAEAGYDGVVFVPEEEGGFLPGHDYDAQLAWERAALDACDVILFWVPRNMAKMPGLTTNVEFGLYVSSGKVVFGAPQGAASVRYLIHTGHRDSQQNFTAHESLYAAVREAVTRLDRATALRTGGERLVPLSVWETASFQSWYASQTGAGNVLVGARTLWCYYPSKTSPMFCWVVETEVWVASENRIKAGNFVLGRTDVSATVLYCKSASVQSTRVVLVREYRLSARTASGFILELPGGTSPDGEDRRNTAQAEVYEETSLRIDPSRFRYVGSRQSAGTLASHHCHVYAVELTDLEWMEVEALVASQEAHGVAGTSERTYVEVRSVRELLDEPEVDWSVVGAVACALKAQVP